MAVIRNFFSFLATVIVITNHHPIIMKSIAPFIVMIAILVTIAVIVIAYLKYRLQQRILDAGLQSDNYAKAFEKIGDLKNDTLKWSILFLFSGIGLVIIYFIPAESDMSALPYGIEAISIGIGLLIYHLISKRK